MASERPPEGPPWSQPDLSRLAEVWVGGDPRLRALTEQDPGRARALSARLARALQERRRQVQSSETFTVNVHPSRLDDQGLPDPEARAELAAFLEEWILEAPPGSPADHSVGQDPSAGT